MARRRPAPTPAPALEAEPEPQPIVDALSGTKEHTPIVSDRDRTDQCEHCGQAAWLDDGEPGRICSGCGRRSD